MEGAQTTRPAVVLIANDQEWSARSLDSILSPQGFAVIRAYTGQQAIDRALSSRPDLIILDAQLPDIHGMEVCRQLRADTRVGHMTPIVITTAGPSGRVQRLAAYAAGAWEFLGQPLDGEALLARLGTFLAIKREADVLREAALVDARSGLYTLHGLVRRMSEIGSDAYRHGRPLACIALGIGRTAPSTTVSPVRLGQLLKEFGRSSDAIAHLGDGEYLVVAPDTATSAVQKLVDRINTAVRREMNEADGSLLVGYSVVDDARVAEVEPAVLLDRATTALRYVMGHADSASVLAFETLPVPAAT
ncbi:MAG TPA: response regulator [Gemmatimonadales bacterium]|nr:response regulator [Gemmatimonadales bacterium]